MAKTASRKSVKRKPPAKSAGVAPIKFSAKLLRPAAGARDGAKSTGGEWLFLRLPKQASANLPSRGMVSVEGTLNDRPFAATLEPDGEGGHWMKVVRKLHEAAGMEAGETVLLEVVPVEAGEEPEPEVPPEFRKALAATAGAGGAKARAVWADITPAARRDWIQWMTSGKRAETRAIRIDKACDMLAKGKRRACCFDRSGMYSKSLSCPVAADE